MNEDSRGINFMKLESFYKRHLDYYGLSLMSLLPRMLNMNLTVNLVALRYAARKHKMRNYKGEQA